MEVLFYPLPLGGHSPRLFRTVSLSILQIFCFGAYPVMRNRFTSASPCPICGGHQDQPRHQGRRCFGFLSEDGRYAHCTRRNLPAGSPAIRPRRPSRIYWAASATAPAPMSWGAMCSTGTTSTRPARPSSTASAARRRPPARPIGWSARTAPVGFRRHG